jgi:hypothetical protein
MTVSASSKDSDGALLQTKIAALSTAVTAAVGKAHYAALSAALDQAQREAVYHFLDTGRLLASSILSTMT